MSGFPSYPYWGTNERFAMNMTRGVEKFDEPFVGILDVRKKYAKIPAVRCPKPRHGGRQGIRFGRHRGLAWV